MALMVFGTAWEASAQDTRMHMEAYQACPAGGLAYWVIPRGPSEVAGNRILAPAPQVDVRWAGDDDWIDPGPVPDDVLTDRLTWTRPDSLLDHHRTIRNEAQRQLPEASTRILLAARTEHWTSLWESTVAVRGHDGLWSVDYLKRYDDGATEVAVRSLDSEASRRLDDLIADPCLALEPFQSEFAHIVTSDYTRWTLEIESLGTAVRVSGIDSGFGRAGAINYLLRGGALN